MLKKHLQKIVLLFITLTFTSLQATTEDIPDKSNDIDDDYIMPQVEKGPVDNSLASEDLEDKKNRKDNDIKREIKIIKDLKEPVDNSASLKNDFEREIKIIKDQKEQLAAQCHLLTTQKNILQGSYNNLEKQNNELKKSNRKIIKECNTWGTLCSILVPTVLTFSTLAQYSHYNNQYNALEEKYNAIEHNYNSCKNASNEMLNAIADKYNISTIAFTWDLELFQNPDQEREAFDIN